MDNKLYIDVPKLYKSKIFIDPLEEKEGTLNVTIVEFEKILYFAKRTGYNRHEAYVIKHNFIIPDGENVLSKSNLTVEQYLNLLLSKSKEVQERAHYTQKQECVMGNDLLDIASRLEILNGKDELFVRAYLGAYKKDGYKEDK